MPQSSFVLEEKGKNRKVGHTHRLVLTHSLSLSLSHTHTHTKTYTPPRSAHLYWERRQGKASPAIYIYSLSHTRPPSTYPFPHPEDTIYAVEAHALAHVGKPSDAAQSTGELRGGRTETEARSGLSWHHSLEAQSPIVTVTGGETDRHS